MILARISKAIREQNWFAVVLEFVIVIAGVVIGFQVTAWNEGRVRESRAVAMQDRLAVDLEAERWRIAATSLYLEDMVSEAEQALQALDGTQTLSDEQLVIRAFRGSQYFWAGILRSTYDELVFSGEINLLPDNIFRNAAIEYYNSSTTSLLSEPGETPYRNAFRQSLSPALHRELVANCAEDPNVQIGDYDALEQFLDFPCEIDGLDSDIAALAERLRNDGTLVGLLRWRVIEAEQNQTNLVYFGDLLDRALADYRDRKTTP